MWLSDCAMQEIWTEGGFHLLYSHAMFLSLGFKQGTRLWSQELYLGVSHSRMPSDLKMTYSLHVCSWKWEVERQRNMICDKSAFHQIFLQRSEASMDFLLLSKRIRIDVKWIKIINRRRKSFIMLFQSFLFDWLIVFLCSTKPYYSHDILCRCMVACKPNPSWINDQSPKTFGLGIQINLDTQYG